MAPFNRESCSPGQAYSRGGLFPSVGNNKPFANGGIQEPSQISKLNFSNLETIKNQGAMKRRINYSQQQERDEFQYSEDEDSEREPSNRNAYLYS